MKKLTFLLLVTLSTFILGVAVVLIWVNLINAIPQNSQNFDTYLPIVDYCELANNPEKYDGKIVRINARLYGYFPFPRFLDKENCYSPEKLTTVIFTTNELQKKIEEQVFLNDIHSSQEFYLAFPMIDAIGKFSRVKPSQDTKSSDYDTNLRFEVLSIENISEPINNAEKRHTADLAFFFKKDVTSDQQKLFINAVLFRYDSQTRNYIFQTGITNLFSIQKSDFEGYGIGFLENATPKQRDKIRKTIEESPLIYKVYKNVTATQINDL